MSSTAVMTRTREYHRCPECRESRHDLMFPWADPDATLQARPRRTTTEASRKAQQKRIAQYDARRRAGQAKGRDYSACLPCRNGDA